MKILGQRYDLPDTLLFFAYVFFVVYDFVIEDWFGFGLFATLLVVQHALARITNKYAAVREDMKKAAEDRMWLLIQRNNILRHLAELPLTDEQVDWAREMTEICASDPPGMVERMQKARIALGQEAEGAQPPPGPPAAGDGAA